MSSTPRQPRPGTTARRALDAHVHWLLDQFTGAALDDWLTDTLDNALRESESLPLEAVVPRALVHTTALRYAADLPLTGGIPDLIAEMATAIRRHPGLDNATLADLLPEETFQRLLEKVLEMRPLRRQLLRQLGSDQGLQRALVEILFQGLHGLLAERLEHGWMKRIGAGIPRRVGEQAEDALHAAITTAVQRGLSVTGDLLTSLDGDAIQDIIETLWDDLRHQPLAPLRDRISDTDIDDFVALGFAVWQERRNSPLYRDLISSGVDAFFDRHGKTPLRALLEDLGIDRDIIRDELLHYAVPILRVLRRKKVLERLLRHQLTPFYASQAFADAVANPDVNR